MRRARRWPPLRGNRKQVAAPRRQGDEQPLVRKLVTVPLEDPVVDQVGKSPAAAAQAGLFEPDSALGGLSGEVDHHQVRPGAGSLLQHREDVAGRILEQSNHRTAGIAASTLSSSTSEAPPQSLSRAA